MGDNNNGADYKIVGINLAIFVAYLVVSMVPNGIKNPSGAVVLFPIHVIACFIISLVCIFTPQYRSYAGQWFLSCFLVLLIGFSTCFLALAAK
jgi:hypothetical protein